MARRHKYTISQMMRALRKGKGIVSQTAEILGCSESTVRNYLKEFPHLTEVLEEERDTLIDLAEAQLIQKVEEGDWQAIKYTLSTLGKKRGYVEATRLNLTGDDGDGGPPVINLNITKVPARVLERGADGVRDDGNADV